MSEFARYEPRPARGPAPPSGVRIEEARPGDRDAVAQISARREGGDVEGFRERIGSRLEDRDQKLFVARLDGEVVGFGRFGRLSNGTIPDGWYLTGVVVMPEHRRRGIGRALTEERLRWLEGSTDRVFYVANSANRVTIDLHDALGFREVERGVTVPGCAFEGGEGVLYVRKLA